jgi:hypothetical protein
MNELQTKTAVLVLQYDANNTYGEKASERARSALHGQNGIVELAPNVFIVDLGKAFHSVTSLVISEDRRFVGKEEARHLHFVLIPCQSPVVGALTEELKGQLDALGLKNWEIGYPKEPR